MTRPVVKEKHGQCWRTRKSLSSRPWSPRSFSGPRRQTTKRNVVDVVRARHLSSSLSNLRRRNERIMNRSISRYRRARFFFLPCSMAVPDVPDVGSRAVSVCFFFSFRLGSDLQKKKKKDSTGFAHLYCDGGEMQRTGEKLGGRRSDRVESMQWHVVNTNQKGQKKTNQTNTRNSFGPGRCEEVSGNGEKQKTHAE